MVAQRRERQSLLCISVCLFDCRRIRDQVRRYRLPHAAAAGLFVVALATRGDLARFLVVSQFSIFVAAGVGLLALTTADLWQNRDAESALLVLWLLGTFVFCWFINWMSSTATILPMVPAANILIVRRIQRHAGRSWQFVPLAFVALLAMAVAWADLCVADTARLAASEIRDRYGRGRGAVLFAGHWGFQYYMEAYGFKPIDYGSTAAHREGTRVRPGDIIILPENNTNVEYPPRWLAQRTQTRIRFMPGLGHSLRRDRRPLSWRVGAASLCHRLRATRTLLRHDA